MSPIRNSNGEFIFSENLEFRPNLSPREIFTLGSFGGTYWRPIYSSITNKHYKDIHKKYPKSWLKNIPEDHLTRDWKEYDKNVNKYNVKVGTTLEFWESKKWITKYHPYGWIQWYFDYFQGKRCTDDEKQINRWLRLAGPNGRFRKWLVTQIIKKKKTWNDAQVSPAIRQTLQHWGYKMTNKDYKLIVKERK
jgi:hypothetical protein